MSYEVFDPNAPRRDGRAAQPKKLSDLLGQTSNGLITRAGSSVASLAAWHAAVGARERDHTRAVYLAEPDDPKNRSGVRTLVVYVDSNSVLQDFRTNAELYQLKLAHYGLTVDRLDFRLSNKPPVSRETKE